MNRTLVDDGDPAGADAPAPGVVPAGAPAGRRAYITPYFMRTNAYIEMQKALASDSGFEPRPFALKHLLLEGGLRGVMQRGNLVLVQWLESRAIQQPDGARCRLSLSGSVLFCFYLLVLALSRAEVVYVVHDHAVHDTQGWLRRLSRQLVKLLCRVADLRIVHDPANAQAYRATYLPHPLFWDRPDQATNPERPVDAEAGDGRQRPLRFAMLGAIRPYKAIDTILEVWPAGLPLEIAGRSSPELKARLDGIIERRGLQDCVTIDARHQSDAAFDARMRATDVLILPHATETALVSGAFFEALGRVPYIVARRSLFIDWVSREFPNVIPFDQPSELPALLGNLPAMTAQEMTGTVDRARSAFGWEACQRSWGAFLRGIGRGGSGRLDSRG